MSLLPWMTSKPEGLLRSAMTDKGPHTMVGAEVRGDSLYVTARKVPSSWDKIRRSGQHHAFEATITKDARARILKKYTNAATEAAPPQKD